MLSARLMNFRAGMLQMCRAQFPKVCASCRRSYSSFKEYVETVRPIGAPKLDDLEDADPIGLMSFANCPCGSTLTLRCEDPTGSMHHAFNEAVKLETAESGRSLNEILVELRELLRAEAVKAG